VAGAKDNHFLEARVTRVDGDLKQNVVCEHSHEITNADELSRSVSNPADSAHGRELSGAVFVPAVIVGRIAAIRPAMQPLVDFPSNTSGALVPARSLIAVTEKEVGKEVALVFEDGDPAKPIIVGVMQNSNQPDTAQQVTLDDETLILSAKKEVMIRCGKASITLTNAGKVLIRGAYLLSRSSGVNRIKGGSVQIN
jgi:hypothetical protein